MRKSSLFAKSILPGIVLCLSLTTVSAFALNHFRIVNKDPTPLSFTIEKNGANAPELPSNFILLSKQSIKTVIPNSNQEVYIGVKPINTPTGVVAFFGINKYGKQLILSGYLGQGIAYSWNNGKNITVKFCSPEQYSVQNHC